MESQARRQKKMDPSRNPSQELQELLEVMARSIASEPHLVTVAGAHGRGFVHFEVRCPSDTREELESRYQEMRSLMQVAGSVRRTRITMQLVEHTVPVGEAPDEVDPSKALERLVLTMARALADMPDDVVVFPADGDGFSHYDVRCDTKDVGALLGGRGSHAKAMRALLEVAGRRRGIRASLHIMARDGNA